MTFLDSKPGTPSGNIFEASDDDPNAKRVVPWPLVLSFLVVIALVNAAIVYLTPVTFQAHSVVAWNEPAAFRSMEDLRSIAASDLVLSEIKKLAQDAEPPLPIGDSLSLEDRIELKIKPSLDSVAVHFRARDSDEAISYANLAGEALVVSLNSTHDDGWRLEEKAATCSQQKVFPLLAVVVATCLLLGLGALIIFRTQTQASRRSV